MLRMCTVLIDNVLACELPWLHVPGCQRFHPIDPNVTLEIPILLCLKDHKKSKEDLLFLNKTKRAAACSQSLIEASAFLHL